VNLEEIKTKLIFHDAIKANMRP